MGKHEETDGDNMLHVQQWCSLVRGWWQVCNTREGKMRDQEDSGVYSVASDK